MRLAPVVLHWFGTNSGDLAKLAELARQQGVVTHAATSSQEACEAFAECIRIAITASDKEAIFEHAASLEFGPEIAHILSGSWRYKSRHEIRSSGFVLHSFEAAMWCFGQTGSFRDAVLLAANMSDDADTTAAITGQLAGAYYGLEQIPSEWRQRLAWYDKIEAMGRALVLGSSVR